VLPPTATIGHERETSDESDVEVPLAVLRTASRENERENSDAFAKAFAGAVMTEATQRRDADLQEDLAAEVNENF
jgi:hypothetical protein